MARIDFHSNVSDKLEYACRLTRKIWSATPIGEPVRNIVMVGEKADLQKLDELLWIFSSTEFLPHCFIEDEAAIETPIVLSMDCSPSTLSAIPHADILIHLGMRMPDDVPALVARFPRIVEVVTVNEAERLAGRDRYKAYRDLGHELHNFDQSKS
ncbi:DNA polymerase III subunit chi [Polynucleobacter sphagniphilus]|jgi:DNA polymerase-3 subunit chi|uniref:DNA polymerase-3 subunit chi n=1 Tax=Polynucleobacter sphagniphilus TaxID=1743169 RepID=A0AA43MAP1_9BURK|nr:DNA polymerase III subunit chi [Polynucleobacter sphagniphilus]MDF9788365.1 DNA polymerase-3 subunit chi [Polynucleobacter sphagniphilus]MDH6154754.1 DNA polymerase-3 subunit chi [Polynucleobacter sphagniphilus]MDH6241280.1 DNA polymerase-3 subunit chi [Polynucleobacter sphagniphilus]MDH6248663.1 DNA polymerase-3 subunit chi [Polynucleobacter sphagniphilus]MDH6300625.1 DNA polymerase-3 subunit chi [Polynucleobacter sphagniphilus]